MPAARSPWFWIPTLYFFQAIPNVLIVTVSVLLYTELGLSNPEIAFYTSLLYLPWVLKPLWSPAVELLRTRRWWIVAMQALIAICLGGVTGSLGGSSFLLWSLLSFWLAAFASATHDIAADGFYLLALRQDEQALFVGIRSFFFRLAMISINGGLVVLAGELGRQMPKPAAWQYAFGLAALASSLLALYHSRILPFPASDRPGGQAREARIPFLEVFASFFRKPGIGLILAYILLYRLGESQLVKLAQPFLKAPLAEGGLGLSTTQVGLVYGTFGVGALVGGGILGGIAISLHGLKRWIWWMVAAINVPNLGYVLLAWLQPNSIWAVGAAVVAEQFGYGFGFSAFMMYLMYAARGAHQTAHYAIGTGFMAAGMMLPGMISGWIQSQTGYLWFFVWVVIATIPAFVLTAFIPLDAEFGKRRPEQPDPDEIS